ncbi:pinin/SDK/memA/ protein conserved region domain-containing protein [Trichoderma novae-zelandiae]
MATMGETATETETFEPKPIEEGQPTPGKGPDTSLKRKAEDEAAVEDSPKRVKHDDDDNDDDKEPGSDAVAPSERQPSERQPSERQPSERQPSERQPSERQPSERQPSPSPDRRDDGKDGAPPPAPAEDRRKQAIQEEKRRGKRLFGGLMSTLSQTSNTSQQQKRRQEIERRQQDRMQKQKTEDDQRRTERLEKLRAVRMADQIVFEEEVMKKKHEKRLAMARFLRTRAEPAIFYLPYRTTAAQKEIIDDQIEKARVAVDKEVEQFKVRKQRHIERYGPPTRQRSVTPDEPAAARAPEGESPPQSPHHSPDKPQVQERRASSDGHKGHHDELGDDLEEAEEDMVIY